MKDTTDFEALWESAFDALVEVDPGGVIRMVNRQTESLFGYDRSELVGKPIEAVVPEAVHQAQQEGYFADPTDTRAMGTVLELTGLRRDGTEFPVDVSLSSIETDAGLSITATVRDVTERRNADQDLQQLAAIVNNSDDAIIGETLDGIVTSWNPAAEKVFGYCSGEIVGKSIDLLSPQDQTGEIESILADVGAGLHVDQVETTRIRKDGTPITVSLSVSPIRDENATIVGASTITLEVTEASQAFESARSMIESSLDALVAISPEGMITDVNEATVKVTGIPRVELIGTAFSECFTDPEKAKAIYELVFEQGMAVDPLTMRHRDGTLTEVLYNASVYRDAGGKVLGVFAAARDVTEVRQAFESARSMIESSLDALVAISPEGMITDVNQATVKVTGIPRVELIGTAFSECFTDPEKAKAIYEMVFEQGMAVDYPLTMRHRDGTLTEVLYNASVHRDAGGKVLGVFAAARDVTEARQAFESARSMIESSLDALVAISPEGMITDVNEATVKVTGIPRVELIGTAFSECFTDSEKANAIYQLVFEQGMAVDYPLTMCHRDGTLTEVLYNASVHRDAGGKVLGVFAAARDVTKQRQAGAQYTRSLLEAALDPLVTISPGGKITDVNEATAKVTGVPREELIGTDFSGYFTQPDRANEGYQLVFDQGSVTDYPLTMRHRDGKLTEVLYNASVYRDEAGKVLGVFAAARDVTEQHTAQAELATQAKELDRLAELERFQRLTIGRELRMIELKKENESLKRLVQMGGDELGDGS